MKKLYIYLIFLFCNIALVNKAKACYADFAVDYACTGDTVWFIGYDVYSIHSWDFGDTLSPYNTAFDDTVYHVFNNPGTYVVTHFNNIGAEWDYEIDIITIGADCDFFNVIPNCYGGSTYNFTFEFTTMPDSVVVDAGDAGSVTDILSTNNAMYGLSYTYVNYGSTNATIYYLTAGNWDTTTLNFTVYSDCIDETTLTPPDFITNTYCLGDTNHFSLTISDPSYLYTWNFGDGSSSTLANPDHIYASSGYYTVVCFIVNPLTSEANTIYTIIEVVDCRVFPGDGNRDGIVNMIDLFTLGLTYNTSGIARVGATTSFTPQSATDWVTGGVLSGWMYLQRMINFKHADYNGDGIINNSDANVVGNNYKLTHGTPHYGFSPLVPKNSDPIISASNPSSTVSGNSYTVPLSLSNTGAGSFKMYGAWLTLTYDPNLVDPASISVNFTGNIFTATDPNTLVLYKVNTTNNTVEIGITMTNQISNTLINGLIANVSFVANSNSVSSNPLMFLNSSCLVSNQTTFVSFANVLAFQAVNLSPSTNYPVGLNEVSFNTNNIESYPNPVTSFLHINSEFANQTISITDIKGSTILQNVLQIGDNKIDVSSLPKGVYFINGKNEKGIFFKKIIKE